MSYLQTKWISRWIQIDIPAINAPGLSRLLGGFKPIGANPIKMILRLTDSINKMKHHTADKRGMLQTQLTPTQPPCPNKPLLFKPLKSMWSVPCALSMLMIAD